MDFSEVFSALATLQDVTGLLEQPLITEIVLAVATVLLGMILGKLAKRIIHFFGKSADIKNKRAIDSFSILFEWFIFVLAIIIALSFLGVNAAAIIIQNIISLLPPLISLFLLLFLGFIIINLVIDILSNLLYRVGLGEYLAAVDISKDVLNNIFSGIKIFLYLILLSSSLSYVGLNIPSIDMVVIVLLGAIIILFGALVFYAFKEVARNFIAGIFIEKNLLKTGQRVKIGEFNGEVIAVTNHGTLLKLPTGYNVFIPNKQVLESNVFIKRARAEINKLESIRANFVTQMPSYCGPAAASMALSFFGFDVTQEDLGRLSETRVPGGTAPKRIVTAVKKASGNAVNGVLIRYEDIYNLKEEVKSWLSEGGLLILWFKKPVIFPEKKSRSGHYVLCVGVEGDELIVMDPSTQTAGVYLVDHRLMEEAMASDFDRKSRGYIVLAKKGTSAFWRINQGLIFSDVAAYKGLSKSFERYLKRLLRKTASLHDLIAEPVTETIKGETKITPLWAPKKETAKISAELKEEQDKLEKEAQEKEEAEREKKGKGKEKKAKKKK
jgi:hypothetical protein